jgi:2Fe-2S ferredoxin
MVQIRVTQRDGGDVVVDAPTGQSLMQGLRDGGVTDIAAICGGYCLCGTCHVYVDESDLDRLPPQGDDEQLLLEGILESRENSRLTCQIECVAALEGMHVTVAPGE